MSIPVSIHAIVYPSMISAPERFINVPIGETVSFRWHYNSGDLKNDLFEVVFGIWKSPGFLKTKLIAVNSSGFASTRSSYKSSVGWAGNLTSSVAVFELYNVKLEDGKTYGIVVEYGLQNTPLTDSVQLQVESRGKKYHSRQHREYSFWPKIVFQITVIMVHLWVPRRGPQKRGIWKYLQ